MSNELGGCGRKFSWPTQCANPAFFWKDYERRQTTTGIVHIPSKIRLKQLFEYMYRVAKSSELEGYQLTSCGRGSSVDIDSRLGAGRRMFMVRFLSTARDYSVLQSIQSALEPTSSLFIGCYGPFHSV